VRSGGTAAAVRLVGVGSSPPDTSESRDVVLVAIAGRTSFIDGERAPMGCGILGGPGDSESSVNSREAPTTFSSRFDDGSPPGPPVLEVGRSASEADADADADAPALVASEATEDMEVMDDRDLCDGRGPLGLRPGDPSEAADRRREPVAGSIWKDDRRLSIPTDLPASSTAWSDGRGR
jgi:hypothetical protein